eukprot:SAG31_NODE_3230_length_4516_cov_3.158252_5_plen_94_part_00
MCFCDLNCWKFSSSELLCSEGHFLGLAPLLFPKCILGRKGVLGKGGCSDDLAVLGLGFQKTVAHSQIPTHSHVRLAADVSTGLRFRFCPARHE